MFRDTVGPFRRLQVTKVFRGLIVLDVALIGLFVLAYYLVNRGHLAAIPDSLQLARERSIPETLSYAKMDPQRGRLPVVRRKTRQRHCGTLAILIALIAIDDILLIHETYGWVVAEKLSIPIAFAMDPKEIGEVVVFGLMGGCAFLLLAAAFVRTDFPGKILTLAVLCIILGLGVAGVLFDAFHHMSAELPAGRLRRLVGLGLTIAEDGGEMILASAMLSLCVMQTRSLSLEQPPRPAPEKIRR